MVVIFMMRRQHREVDMAESLFATNYDLQAPRMWPPSAAQWALYWWRCGTEARMSFHRSDAQPDTMHLEATNGMKSIAASLIMWSMGCAVC